MEADSKQTREPSASESVPQQTIDTGLCHNRVICAVSPQHFPLSMFLSPINKTSPNHFDAKPFPYLKMKTEAFRKQKPSVLIRASESQF